ncbi:hypothetical protein V1517DRAFT_354502 [Lipomyces orientalis]|uniref:Uncharacterized protein n=1 Tax=Lipomyces orientalis TaxID=1233043 RepID=A0ACC3TH35_9ASCO
MNTDAYYSPNPTHRTTPYVVRDDNRENNNYSYSHQHHDLASQVNLLDRYPNESLIERMLGQSDRRFLMPAQPARLNVAIQGLYPEPDLDDAQATTAYQAFRNEERDRSGASPETLAAISEYLHSPDMSSCKAVKVRGYETYKSSDSNKENIDPDLDLAMPVRNPDRIPDDLRDDLLASDLVECSIPSNITDEDFQPLLPPFEMSESISEIMFNDPPSFRKMLSTSTVNGLQDIGSRRGSTSGNGNDHNQTGSYTSSAQFATQPPMYGSHNSERHRQLMADMGYQRAASFSTVSGAVRGKLDTFLAGEYVKRPVLRSRKFSLKLNVDTNKGYLGGTSLEGEICIKLKRWKENATVRISRVEIATVCVEEVGSSKRVIDSCKLFMRSDINFCNAGLNVISFSTTLPKTFGPGYFAGPRAKIRYFVFLCASADQNDISRLLRTSEEIKFYNTTNVEHPTSLHVSRVVTKTNNVRFVGCGSVSVKIESAQDYFEAGKYCYLRTTVFNQSSSVVNRLKMTVVRCTEYLDSARRTRRTEERVIANSTFKASRDGWPKVEPMTQAAYTSAVRIPEFAVSIISSGFRVDYHVDMSVGGLLRQYVTARFPLTVFFKPERFGPLVSHSERMRRHVPGVFTTPEPPGSLREIGLNRPFQGYRDTLTRNVDRIYSRKAESEVVPMAKKNFKSTESVENSGSRAPRLQTPNVVLRRDIRENNGVDGFYSMRSMQDREQLAGAANDRLRQLLKSMFDHPRARQERDGDDVEKLHDWDCKEPNMAPESDDPGLPVPTVAVARVKKDCATAAATAATAAAAAAAADVPVPVDNSKCFV